MAFLNRGLTIEMPRRAGRRSSTTSRPREVTYHYEGGIADFVRHINAQQGPRVHSTSSSSQRRTPTGISLEVAMQWNGGYNESVYTFANTINTHEGGTHEEGFRASLTSLVNRYARDVEPPQGKGRQPVR